jgi:hypothetical protein
VEEKFMSQEGPVIPSVTLMEKLDITIEADKAAADARAKSLSNARTSNLAPENYPPKPLPPSPKMPDHPISDRPEKNTGAVVATSS